MDGLLSGWTKRLATVSKYDAEGSHEIQKAGSEAVIS